MCQLLGMNANVPTDICFSFEGFRARGGRTDRHGDGWGIAFFEGRGVRTFLDPAPASDSPIADFVRRYPIKSCHVIAHIRRATQGNVALENCHPFVRELWGRHFVFAHNGDLPGFRIQPSVAFSPVGSTDSEAAFCHILRRMVDEFGETEPELREFFGLLRQETAALSQRGPFNYLLSNDRFLFAHASTTLHYIVRQSPFCSAHLIDEDFSIDFSEVTTERDRVAIIATTPLTDNESWTAVPAGQLLVFEGGAPLPGPM